MENEWVGGIGDRRVLCIDTNRIFSCPESAAYSLNFNSPGEKVVSIKQEDITINCNHYTKSMINGMRFEWYNQYLKDTGIADFYIPPEVVVVPRPDSNRERSLKNKQGPKRYYDDVRKIYRAVKKTYLANPAIMGVFMSIPSFLKAIGIERSSYAAFSKHFSLYKDVYADLFKAEFSKMYSPRSDREVLSIKLNDFKNIGSNPNVDSDWDIVKYFTVHHDSKSAYMRGKRNMSKPVVRLEDNQVFGSVTTASKMIGIEKVKIIWCCEGDIPFCKKWAIRYTFRYAKFSEE
jgi:hypothetical protein